MEEEEPAEHAERASPARARAGSDKKAAAEKKEEKKDKESEKKAVMSSPHREDASVKHPSHCRTFKRHGECSVLSQAPMHLFCSCLLCARFCPLCCVSFVIVTVVWFCTGRRPLLYL